MENRNQILIELQSLSPTIAEIAPVNPYNTPTGYFENLAAQILEIVKSGEPSAILIDASRNPYEVPLNYFETLPEKILGLVLSEKTPLVLKDKPGNPYEVPHGYFEGLADIILARIKTAENLSPKEELEILSPFLSKLDKKTPFSTPAGYFEDLTGNVLGGMQAIDFVNEELENLSPMMSDIRSVNVYEVPAGYFAGLPNLLLEKAKALQPAKIVSMPFRKKAMKYATAAVVAGVIIIAGFLFVNRPGSSVKDGTIALAEEKIQKETQSKVQELSDDELVNFIEDQTAPVPDIASVATSGEIDSDDVKLMIADVPDSELKQYLVNYSDDKEVLTN